VADAPAALVDAAMRSLEGNYGHRDDEIRAFPAIQAIITAPEEVRRQCILAAVRAGQWPGIRLLHYIARKRAGLSLSDIEEILPPRVSRPDSNQAWRDACQVASMTGQIEATWKSLDDAGQARLLPQLERVAAETGSQEAATRLRMLITAADSDRVPYALIEYASGVGQALRAVLAAARESDAAKARLIRLLAGYPATGKPGSTWRKEAVLVMDTLDQPAETIGALLDAALEAPDYEHRYPGSVYQHTRYAVGSGEAFLCGTAVLAGHAAADSADMLPRLRRLALKAITVIGGSDGRPRSIRLANHCVEAIAAPALPSSVTELLRTERGTRHGSLLRQVRKSVDALAAAQGLTRDELLEMAVEEHGLSPEGSRRVPLSGAWLAVIEADARTARLSYSDPDGKPRKSLSPAVKQDSADTLAAVSKDLKAIRTTVGNERARLDACLSAGRTWPMSRWRDLYLDHPVTGRLTRALIWTFRTASGTAVVTGIPVSADTLVRGDGTEVPLPADEAAEVRLWHPVHADAGEVRAWRHLLISRRLVQPVKQAFREVYVLTPAEEETRDYSNRFAGHVFRQEQARALMKGRSWAPVPMAAWDDGIDHGIGRRTYPGAGGPGAGGPGAGGPGLRAEFFFDPADYEDIADSGLFRYCASDQVRFFDADTGRAVPLAEVAPLVFSEAMRDVDLFIGVTSVGADPEWLDRGEGRRFGDYWHRYAFGDLGAGAEVRREVLAGLVPMLAIASRCELEGRFLAVRGDLRTYRIHLGSGNILMSPDDQYLCIVAARDGRAGKLFLPFDDDPVLSLILSKAFLLAEDTKITDPSITQQIRGR
jgi:uncharacterized protein DUF4132